MGKQTKLLENIRANFEGVPIVVIESKCDVMRTDKEVMRISSVTGEGMEELKTQLVERLRTVLRQRALETPLEEVE